MNLREALAMGTGDVVAIVGGGGKTTILYRLGAETASAGGRAVLTGTTRFTPPEKGIQPALILAGDQAQLLTELRRALEQAPVVIAGTGWGNKGRILPLEPDWLAAVAALPGVTAVIAEADGSAGRPFKAPAEHEPVVAAATTLLLTVVGIDVLTKPLVSEKVHRPERVAALTGATLGQPVDEAMVAGVLLHEQGGRKGLPAGARWVPVLNKADTPERIAAARRIGLRLLSGGAERVVIARAAAEPPVAGVLT